MTSRHRPGPTRDFVGYGRRPPQITWPNGRLVAVNLVVCYEEGSEYSLFEGDGHSDGCGESVVGAGRHPRPRHRNAFRIWQPRRHLAHRQAARTAWRPRHDLELRRGAAAQSGGDGMAAPIGSRPARPWLSLDRTMDAEPRRGAGSSAARHRAVRRAPDRLEQPFPRQRRAR